jgi:hypothetical protein
MNRSAKARILKIEQIYQLAKQYGIDCLVRGNGHVTFNGKLQVHYYPFSANLTAYVQGTTKAYKKKSLLEAIEMTSQPPAGNNSNVKRSRKSSRDVRARIIASGVTCCHWCKEPLTVDTATLEHIIPLKRGGLDNRNNVTIACQRCNNARGSDMPELQQ